MRQQNKGIGYKNNHYIQYQTINNANKLLKRVARMYFIHEIHFLHIPDSIANKWDIHRYHFS